MPHEHATAPWDRIEELLEQGDRNRLVAFAEELGVRETARALSRLEPEERDRVLTLLPPEDAAEFIEEIPEEQAAALLGHLPTDKAAEILNEVDSNEAADVLGELDTDQAHEIIASMDPEEAQDARLLVRYEDDVAGGLMITEYLAYPETATVQEVIRDLQINAEKYREYSVQYIYVTTNGQRLAGVLQLRDLLFRPATVCIADIMIAQPVCVRDDATLETLDELFEEEAFMGVPVTDAGGRLLGIIKRADLEEGLAERADDAYLKSQGIVGGEELRSMPTLRRSRRRLSWLSVNIVLNIVAASIIAMYQDTLAAVIALAVFLPMISDMSGCSGNQAVAVSIRELSLGLVKPFEIAHVWLKEISVGVLNGMVLGTLIGAVAFFWKGNPYLGLVVGAALAVNTMIAVSLGGTIPLVLRRLKVDPALASGPVLTTITDISGFSIVLTLATQLLPRLA